MGSIQIVSNKLNCSFLFVPFRSFSFLSFLFFPFLSFLSLVPFFGSFLCGFRIYIKKPTIFFTNLSFLHSLKQLESIYRWQPFQFLPSFPSSRLDRKNLLLSLSVRRTSFITLKLKEMCFFGIPLLPLWFLCKHCCVSLVYLKDILKRSSKVNIHPLKYILMIFLMKK